MRLVPIMTASLLPVLILHTGDPEDAIREHHGGYAEQLRRAAGLRAEEASIVAVYRGEALAPPSAYRAALITGSPAMVTDHEPWSEAAAAWLREAVAAGLPVFGVCYGHPSDALTRARSRSRSPSPARRTYIGCMPSA